MAVLSDFVCVFLYMICVDFLVAWWVGWGGGRGEGGMNVHLVRSAVVLGA